MIGFTVEALPATLVQPIKAACASLSGRYSEPLDIVAAQTQIRIGDPSSSATQQRMLIGVRVNSRDGLFAFQARLDGFYLSRLNPYTRWEDLIGEAKEVFRSFANIYGLTPVQSCTVRYINELEMPWGEKLDKYLRFYTNLPPELPQSILNFYTRHDLLVETDCTATLQMGILPADPDKKLNRLLLDIELKKASLGIQIPHIWDQIYTLRKAKNAIFFGCITPEMEARLN